MDKKSKQLGMNFSTACHRLRKQIMFNLLVRLEENVCFKCGTSILDPQELSIEHKIAWQDNSAELFWDETNLAFSHRKCNTPDRKPGPLSHLEQGIHGTPNAYEDGCRCNDCCTWKSSANKKYRDKKLALLSQ